MNRLCSINRGHNGDNGIISGRRKRFATRIVTVMLTLSCLCGTVSADYSGTQASEIYKNTTIDSMTSKSYAAVEYQSGQLIISGNGRAHITPGNLAKMMTLLITFDAIGAGKITYDSTYSVSENAQKISVGRARVFLDAGKNEMITVQQAIDAICINGANDAAMALAEYVGGNESGFVTMMNDKCRALGLTDTVFNDPTGIDTEQYTCAEDMAVIACTLMREYPESLEFLNKTYGRFEHTSTGEPSTEMVSSNPFNRRNFYTSSDGGMTGYSKADGYALCATVPKDDKRVVGVVMGASDENVRAAELRTLLEYSVRNYEFRLMAAAGTFVKKIDIVEGKETKIKTKVKEDCYLLLHVDNVSKVVTTVEINVDVVAPIEDNVVVGNVIYMLDDEEVGRVELVTAEKMERANWFVRLIRKILSWFGL